ncbi:MAG: GTP cyclohydrolase I FolE [Alphaproteobacteria bacterium]|nr:GTP cyclohydrolase I FolE [Rickettsiales bacterium]
MEQASKKNKALNGLKSVLEYLNIDPNDEGVKRTPERVLKYLEDCCSGYDQDPKGVLSTTFTGKQYNDFVLLKEIEFKSTCEHHLLPIIGKVSIAYFPKNRIVGISKLARIVDIFANRLQLQERMTIEILEAINKHLPNKGIAVFVSAVHYCIKIAGVKKINPVMYTSSFTGNFKKNKKDRDRFLDYTLHTSS